MPQQSVGLCRRELIVNKSSDGGAVREEKGLSVRASCCMRVRHCTCSPDELDSFVYCGDL